MYGTFVDNNIYVELFVWYSPCFSIYLGELNMATAVKVGGMNVGVRFTKLCYSSNSLIKHVAVGYNVLQSRNIQSR